MPSIVEQALPHQERVNPFDQLDRLDISSLERPDALNALCSHGFLVSVSVLNEYKCSGLKRFVVQGIKDDGIKDVDRYPYWQVNISKNKLLKLLMDML